MERLPTPGVHMLRRDWVRCGDELFKCLSSIGTASRRDKGRYAKLLSASLLRNFNEQLSPDDWSAAVTTRIPQLLLVTAFLLCGDTPKEQYWQVAMQSIQTATRFFDPGERVLAEFPPHRIASLHLKLAQQCRDHDQLKLMPGILREILTSLADKPTLNGAFVAARCSCAQHALPQQRVCSSEDMPKLQCSIALLQLFHALNSLWPGQAGLLATPEGQAAAGPAVELAVELIEQAAGLDRQSKGQMPDPVAAAAVNIAIDATALLVRQLSNRLHHSRQSMHSSEEQHEGFDQQLLNSPAVLHMLLLLADMHLQQLPGNSSTGTSSCSHSINTDGAGATAVQQYHKQLLLSFCGLSDQLWQGIILAGAATAAEAQQVDYLSVLGLLLAALRKLKGRCLPFGGAATDARDVVICTLLSRFMSALTHTAQQQWRVGSYELAAAALETVQEASMGLEVHGIRCREPDEKVAADSAAVNARTVMSLASEQQQLVLDLLQGLMSCMQVFAHQASAPSAVADSTGEICDCDSNNSPMTDIINNPTSRTDSSSGPDALQAKLLGLLVATAGRVSGTASYDPPSTVGAAECSTTPHMQVTPARVVECSLRTAAQQVCAATGTCSSTQPSQLLSGIAAVLSGDLCTEGVPTKRPSPAPCWLAERPAVQFPESGSSCPVQQTIAASAAQSVKARDVLTNAAHKGLFALLVSSLKLAQPAGSTCVSDKVEDIVGVLINDAVKASQQAAHGAPLTSLSEVQAAPWLVIMARCMMLEAEALQSDAVLSITAAQSSAAESASRADGGATANYSTTMAVLDVFSLRQSIQRVCSCLNFFEAAACCAQVAPAAAAVGLQQELTVLWQSLEQQLMPQLQLAADIVLYTATLDNGPRRKRQALQQQLSSNPVTSELVGQLQTAGTVLAQSRILSTSFIAHLHQELKAASQQLCVLLPLPLCCNNPTCSNMI